MDTQKIWDPLSGLSAGENVEPWKFSVFIMQSQTEVGGGYCIHMNKEARLLHTDEQGVRVYGALLG